MLDKTEGPNVCLKGSVGGGGEICDTVSGRPTDSRSKCHDRILLIPGLIHV
jgi:hypothetical protein